MEENDCRGRKTRERRTTNYYDDDLKFPFFYTTIEQHYNNHSQIRRYALILYVLHIYAGES